MTGTLYFFSCLHFDHWCPSLIAFHQPVFALAIYYLERAVQAPSAQEVRGIKQINLYGVVHFIEFLFFLHSVFVYLVPLFPFIFSINILLEEEVQFNNNQAPRTNNKRLSPALSKTFQTFSHVFLAPLLEGPLYLSSYWRSSSPWKPKDVGMGVRSQLTVDMRHNVAVPYSLLGSPDLWRMRIVPTNSFAADVVNYCASYCAPGAQK